LRLGRLPRLRWLTARRPMPSHLGLPDGRPQSSTAAGGLCSTAKSTAGGPRRVIDRDRGEPRDSAPPTPPGIRVRTAAVREVGLTSSEQGGETKRYEVCIGKPQ